MSPELGNTGINAAFEKRGEIKLTFPSGETFVIEIPKITPPETPEKVLTALGVMRLAIPLAFPEETLGVESDFGYRVTQEEVVSNLPGDRENDYRTALSWAGAVLQKEGWSTGRVSDLLISERSNIQAGFQLGTVTPDQMEVVKFRLKSKVTEFYPGAAASFAKARRKKVPDW